MKFVGIGWLCIALCGCASGAFKVASPDWASGYYPTQHAANVATAIDVQLDTQRQLLLQERGYFTHTMVSNIGYFDVLIDRDELETRIIAGGLVESVGSVNDRMGLYRAARDHQPFLWLRWAVRETPKRRYQQLILTDPLTATDLFVCETPINALTGVRDEVNAYPLFNALINYIASNSLTFRQ